MIKRGIFCVVCTLIGAIPLQFAAAQPPKTARAFGVGTPKTLSSRAYAALLRSALREVNALEHKPPRPLRKIVGKLERPLAVRRADGQVQNVDGDFWSNFARHLTTPRNASRGDVKRASQALQMQIRALDEWQTTPAYQNANAQKILAGLADSGQIRVGPLAWQKMLSNAWGAVTNAWAAFWKWFYGLFPTPKASKIKALPSDKWLWLLFYGIVAALLGTIVWFVWRAFGGRWGARGVKVVSDLHNEDADLLLLAPAELLSRAAQFAAQGNFREALRHRYLSLLVDLDARGAWRYDARRTNWEHIAALRRQNFERELLAPLSALTRRFDRVRYGGAPCDDEAWRRFDADAREFESRATGQKAASRSVTTGAQGAEVTR